jgi:sugar phosphate isomerase/epimerase
MIRTFSTLGCETLDLDDVLALARTYGLAGVELRALGGTTDLVSYFLTHFASPERLAARVASSGVAVVALDASCRLMAEDTAGAAELLALAPWAEALGGVPIRVFDGGTTLSEAEMALGLARWAWWQQQRTAHGWACEIMVETHDTLITGEAVNRFRRRANASVPILWDAFHTWSKGGESPVDTWGAIGDAVRHIHVKDGVAGGESGRAWTHTLPGSGDFPMAALRERLERDGFRGPLSLEWGRKWHPYLPALEMALQDAASTQWW